MKGFLLLILFFLTESMLAQDFNTGLNRFIKEQDSIRQTYIGKKYPAFVSVTMEGDTISEKMLPGKVTFLNFWFETCAPCIAEFEELKSMYERYKDDQNFQFISFTTDSYTDAKKTVRKYKLPYKVCHISRDYASKMNFNQGFPTNIVIDKKGNVVFLKAGGATDQERVKKAIKEIDDIIAKNL